MLHTHVELDMKEGADHMHRLLIGDFRTLLEMALHSNYWTRPKLRSELATSYGARPALAFQWVVAVWCDYCGIPWATVRKTKSFELIQLLNLYVMCFDRIADTKEGMPQLVANVDFAKHHQEMRTLIQAISNWILYADISQEKKKVLVVTLQNFRNASRLAYQSGFRLQLEGDITLEGIFPAIEETTGRWLATYAKMLNILHEISEPTASRIHDILYRFGAFGQLFDDAIDYAHDLDDGALNLVDAGLRQFPSEREAAEKLLWHSHRVWGWLPIIAPKTYHFIKRFFLEQLALLEAIDPGNEIVHYVRQVAIALFRISIVHKLLPDMLQRNIEAVTVLARR